MPGREDRAEADDRAALIRAFTVSARRNPKRRRTIGMTVFMPSAPTTLAKVIRPDWKASGRSRAAAAAAAGTACAPMPMRRQRAADDGGAERRDIAAATGRASAPACAARARHRRRSATAPTAIMRDDRRRAAGSAGRATEPPKARPAMPTPASTAPRQSNGSGLSAATSSIVDRRQHDAGESRSAH